MGTSNTKSPAPPDSYSASESDAKSIAATANAATVIRPRCGSCQSAFLSLSALTSHLTVYRLHVPSDRVLCLPCGHLVTGAAHELQTHFASSEHAAAAARNTISVACGICSDARFEPVRYTTALAFDEHLSSSAHLKVLSTLAAAANAAINPDNALRRAKVRDYAVYAAAEADTAARVASTQKFVAAAEPEPTTPLTAVSDVDRFARPTCLTCKSVAFDSVQSRNTHTTANPSHLSIGRFCMLCGTQTTSAAQLIEHSRGSGHRNAVVQFGSASDGLLAYCVLCSGPDDVFNSADSFDRHLRSAKHAAALHRLLASSTPTIASPLPRSGSAAVVVTVAVAADPDRFTRPTCLTCKFVAFDSVQSRDAHMAANPGHQPGGPFCLLCGIRTIGRPQFEQHINGSGHRNAAAEFGSAIDGLLAYCVLCSGPDDVFNSADKFDRHLRGAKHASKLSELSVTEPFVVVPSSDSDDKTAAAPKPIPDNFMSFARPACTTCNWLLFDSMASAQHHYSLCPSHRAGAFCTACGVRTVSMKHFDEHILSYRHKAAVESRSFHVWCTVCRTENEPFPSAHDLDLHLRGRNHADRVRDFTGLPAPTFGAVCDAKSVPNASPLQGVTDFMAFARPACTTCDWVMFDSMASAQHHSKLRPSHIASAFCMPCGVRSISMKDFAEHVSGNRHKSAVAVRSFHVWCSVCRSAHDPFPSVHDLDMHLRGREHSNRVQELNGSTVVPAASAVSTGSPTFGASDHPHSRPTCFTCRSPFPSADTLTAHIKIHPSHKRGISLCVLCIALVSDFDSHVTSKRHLSRVDRGTVGLYCPLCGPTTFTTSVESFDAHLSSAGHLTEINNSVNRPVIRPPVSAFDARPVIRPPPSPSPQPPQAAAVLSTPQSAMDRAEYGSTASAAAVARKLFEDLYRVTDDSSLTPVECESKSTTTFVAPSVLAVATDAVLDALLPVVLESASSALVPVVSAPGGPVSSPYRVVPCRFLLEPGGCRKGDACTYIHPSGKKVCNFFNKPVGCTRGAACQFMHSVVDSKSVASPIRIPPPALANASIFQISPKPVGYCDICNIDCVGRANYENHCRMAERKHKLLITSSSNSGTDVKTTPAAIPPSTRPPCRYDVAPGGCTKGDACLFVHTAKPKTAVAASSPPSTKPKPYYCMPCNQKFPHEAAYALHRETHNKRLPPPTATPAELHACPICDKEYESAVACLQHCREVHRNNKSTEPTASATTPTPAMTAATTSSNTRPKAGNPSTGTGNFYCSLCNHRFPTKDVFTQHRATH